jgi:hypothetical protein
VVRRGADGATKRLLPGPWSARTRVHEYGGLSYLPVLSPVATATLAAAGGEPDSADPEREPPIVFANFSDQRLYLAGRAVAEGKGQPVPLTPEPGGDELRYADFVLSPDQREVWCVRESHSGGKVRRAIVAVPLDGSASTSLGDMRVLVAGSDFFAFPTPSPDGKWLAWICWNHPHMPWDGTELRVAPMQDGVPDKGRLIKGSNRESVLAPLWRDNSSLYWLVEHLPTRPVRRAAAGPVSGRRGVRRRDLAARATPVRDARRRPPGGQARPRRVQARPA